MSLLSRPPVLSQSTKVVPLAILLCELFIVFIIYYYDKLILLQAYASAYAGTVLWHPFKVRFFRNPILRKDQLALFKRTEYSGERGMLRNDLLLALDWYCTVLDGGRTSGKWLEKSLEVTSSTSSFALLRIRPHLFRSGVFAKYIGTDTLCPALFRQQIRVRGWSPFSELCRTGDGCSITCGACLLEIPWQ